MSDQSTNVEEGNAGKTDHGQTKERRLSLGKVGFQLAFYLLIAGWAVYLFVTSRDWTRTDRTIPTLVIVVLLVLIALKIAQILLKHYDIIQFEGSQGFMVSDGDDDDGDDVPEALKEKFEWLMIGSIVVIAVAIYYLGFMTVLPVATFVLLYLLTDNVRSSFIATVGFTVASYVLFVYVLGVPLYDGIYDIVIPVPFFTAPLA